MRLLKDFQRIDLEPGASAEVSFAVRPADLAFRRADGSIGTETGRYEVYLSGDSTATRPASFVLLDGATANPTKRQ